MSFDAACLVLEECNRQNLMGVYGPLPRQRKNWQVSTAPSGEIRLTEHRDHRQYVTLFPRRLEGVSIGVRVEDVYVVTEAMPDELYIVGAKFSLEEAEQLAEELSKKSRANSRFMISRVGVETNEVEEL